VEEALESEVAPPGANYREYRRGQLATAEGPIEYGVP
jgi:hypothetical protein